MGEGAHFYKIDGKYFITSAWYAGRMRLAAARADRLDGPWEVNREISADETFGLRQGYRLRGNGTGPQIVVTPGTPPRAGTMSMHQGGIVQTPAGEWWGFSMMDANSIGRLTALSPVTWKDGWPYFGLPGNLERTPRVWVKPKTGRAQRADARHTCARRVLRAAPRERLAVEPRAERQCMVADRAPGLAAPALAARRRLLDRAQHAHAARGRPALLGYHAARRCGDAPR